MFLTMTTGLSTAELTPDLILFWYAAESASFTTAERRQEWADRIIVRLETPPHWLLELSSANETETLLQTYSDLPDQLRAQLPAIPVEDATVGFIWLIFQNGKIGLQECLKRLGLEVDASQTELEPETFYEFLNQIEQGRAKEAAIRERVWNIIAPHVNLAQKQWSTINAVEPVEKQS
jgi:hypothetical protein